MRRALARWWRRARGGPARADALLLMYHRVAEGLIDPWGLCVSPANFADHLALLRRRYRVVPLRRLIEQLGTGRVPPRTVVITADDGYADNFLVAAPLLAQADAAATVFVTTDAIGSTREFWWDELERLVLTPEALPEECRFRLAGAERTWRIREDAPNDNQGLDRSQHLPWRAENAAPTARQAFYLELWAALYPLPEHEKRAALDALASWAGASDIPRATHRAMTAAEVAALPSRAPVEVGAHGVTHTPLDRMDPAGQRHEIAASRQRLEEWLGTPVTSFAYPHGAYNDATVTLARDAGFSCSCTTSTGGVRSDTDPLALPRLHVRDWCADDLEQHLLWWFGA